MKTKVKPWYMVRDSLLIPLGVSLVLLAVVHMRPELIDLALAVIY
jgi:hypothetical protein